MALQLAWASPQKNTQSPDGVGGDSKAEQQARVPTSYHPQIPAPPTAADYFAGHDAPLEAAITTPLCGSDT